MGNEVGSNDLGDETSLLNSSKTKEPQHARSGLSELIAGKQQQCKLHLQARALL